MVNPYKCHRSTCVISDTAGISETRACCLKKIHSLCKHFRKKRKLIKYFSLYWHCTRRMPATVSDVLNSIYCGTIFWLPKSKDTVTFLLLLFRSWTKTQWENDAKKSAGTQRRNERTRFLLSRSIVLQYYQSVLPTMLIQWLTFAIIN